MTTRMARTIPIDKHEVRELAKELEREILKAVSRHEGPLGKRILSQRPHTFRVVDGSLDVVHIRLEAVPAEDSNYILSGGLGTTSRGTPVLVISVNGGMDGQVMASGAKSHIVQLQLYPVLLHELTHAADKFTKGFGTSIVPQDLRDDPALYYNDPGEVRAYMQEVVDEASERFKHYEKLKKHFGSRAMTTLLNMSTTWQEVSPHWTSRNQQKVMKAVYQALEDWQLAQRVAGRVMGREIHVDYVRAGVADCVDTRVDASAFMTWLRTGGGEPWAEPEMHHRVLSRYFDAREAKAKGLSLLPDYKKALEKLRDGDSEPAEKFAKKVKQILIPDNGKSPDWFAALSTQKMNAMRDLNRGVQRFIGQIDNLQEHPELLPIFIGQAEEWAKPLRTLEIASVIGDTTLEVERGPFVVVPIPGVTKAQTDGALAALDEAVAKIRPKCPRVLYGKVFFSTHLKKGTAAWYEESSDTLSLNVLAKKRFNDVFTIIHELGHRHHVKFLSKKGEWEYWNLSTRKVYETIHYDAKMREEVADECVSLAKLKALGKPLPSLSETLIRWLKSPHPHGHGDVRTLTTAFLKGEIDEKELHAAIEGDADRDIITDKLLHGPLHVTPYGGTKPSENYADGFAHFILGMDMPAELAEILAEEVK